MEGVSAEIAISFECQLCGRVMTAKVQFARVYSADVIDGIAAVLKGVHHDDFHTGVERKK